MDSTFPKLTVIIPTLNRAETLYYTIKTALTQRYSNYSILISDNYSNDNTKMIVEGFNDSRIKYINPGKRLSMSHHWEFALQNINEGYVTILGDDDGLLPDSLSKVARLLNKYKVDAVGWKFGNYNWKGLPVYFMIPMANYYRLINSKLEIRKIFQKSIYKTIEFPSLYGGFINIDLINNIKKSFDGNFFHSRIPDFFSGGIIAASIDKYLRLEFPITINATSKYSTGFATISKQNEQTSFINLQTGADNIPFHSSLVFIRSNAVPIAEAMLQVHELVPDFPKPNIEKLLEEVLDEAIIDSDIEKFEELKTGVLQIAEKNKVSDFANNLLKNVKHSPKHQQLIEKFSPVSMNLYIDTNKTEISEVEQASIFATKIISRRYYRLFLDRLKIYFQIASTIRYLYLKIFSDEKKFL